MNNGTMPETSEFSSMSRDKLFEAAKSGEQSPEIRHEVEARAKNAEEIMEVYNGTLEGNGERVAISRNLLNKAISESGIKGGNLGFAFEIEGKWLDFDKVSGEQKSGEKPQVWVKPVLDTKEGLFKQTKEKTDEVLVISRLNNSKTEGGSCIAVGLVKQKDGIPQTGERDQGFYALLTEKDYQEIVQLSREELGKKYPGDPVKRMLKEFLTGESTIEKHRKRFKWWTGQEYKRYWKNRDQKIEHTQQRWRTTEHLKQGFMERMQEDYQELMQETVDKNNEVFDEVEARQAERDESLGVEAEKTKSTVFEVEDEPEEEEMTISELAEKELQGKEDLIMPGVKFMETMLNDYKVCKLKRNEKVALFLRKKLEESDCPDHRLLNIDLEVAEELAKNDRAD